MNGANMNDHPIGELLQAAHAADPAMAIAAIQRLGLLKAPEAAPVILARITDEDAAIRKVCTEECVDILGPDAVSLLEGRLLDSVIEIGMTAAQALAYVGTAKAAKVLIRAAASSETVISVHGSYGLGFWTSRDGFKVMFRAVVRGNDSCRGEAALALGRIGDTDALPLLKIAFHNESNEENRLKIATAQTLLGNDKKEFIRQVLRSGDSRLQYAALPCIELVKDKGALFDILPLLGSSNYELAVAAAAALEKIGLLLPEKKEFSRDEDAKLWLKIMGPANYTVTTDGGSKWIT